MNIRKNRFDWVAYYMAAYEEERKKNTQMAGRIADAERRQADLQDNLNRICSNPLYRMAAKASAPLRRAARRMGGNSVSEENLSGIQASQERMQAYEEMLWRQTNPYLQWIAECENKNADVINLPEPIAVQGFREIAVPQTDVRILTYGDGLLAPHVFSEVRHYFAKNSACLLAYADEDFYWEDLTKRMEPWFKPAYSPDTLLAFQYWGHFVAVRVSVLDSMNYRMVSMKDPDLGFYELCLRLEEKIEELSEGYFRRRQAAIGHLDAILYHRKYHLPEGETVGMGQTVSPEEQFSLVQESLKKELAEGRFLTGASAKYVTLKEDMLMRRGGRGELRQGADPDIYHLLYDTSVSGTERCTRSGSENTAIAPHRMVSVVIPSKDHPEVLEKCLRSFREKTQYRFYEWIVVDNGSSGENREKMEALQKIYGFTYIYEPMPFDFSRMCNLGEKRAKGDLILLMNDDIEIIEGSWLERMAGQAMLPHVGAVGAKLWYAGTENIQHAGVTNLKIGPSHKLITFPDEEDYYFGRNRVTYNVAAVTAACLMVSRKKYEKVGGLDESLPVAYNDVDFCFKLLEAGYVNVQRNDVILCHHESLSRGLDEQNEGKWERLLAEKEALYGKHPALRGKDPFYHKDLIDNASNYMCNYKFPHEDRLCVQEASFLPKSVLRRLMKRAGHGVLRLTVDRAEPQHKILADEPDILWIMGWSYIPGADNAAFGRKVILQRTDGAGYLAAPADWHRADVEAILPQENHVGLAGFVLRLRREELA
ncbi:MAG: glycosyltransferase, partial [Lachnospiraceae bacterium]|nr:glycosyltransferase [Lachnospiraceae bacterium]